MPYRLLFPEGDQGSGAHRLAPESIPFASTCPKCQVERSQRGNRTALKILLEYGHPIEAFCEVCREYWNILALERAEIARDVAG